MGTKGREQISLDVDVASNRQLRDAVHLVYHIRRNIDFMLVDDLLDGQVVKTLALYALKVYMTTSMFFFLP